MFYLTIAKIKKKKLQNQQNVSWFKEEKIVDKIFKMRNYDDLFYFSEIISENGLIM